MITERLLLIFLLFYSAQAAVDPDTRECIGDGNGNLPWDDYTSEAIAAADRATNQRVIDYKHQEAICCSLNTAFLMSRDYAMKWCEDKYAIIKGNIGRAACKETCYKHYQKWVMGIAMDTETKSDDFEPACEGSCPQRKCLTATYTVCDNRYDDECTESTCTLYTVFPKELGGPDCELAYYLLKWRGGYRSDYQPDIYRTWFIKPQCSFEESGFYRAPTTPIPRVPCSRDSLPWIGDQFHEDMNMNDESVKINVRVRLYEKLQSICCSAETAFITLPGRKYKDGVDCPFIKTIRWITGRDEEGLPSGGTQPPAYDRSQQCQNECFAHFQRWVAGQEDQPCHAAILRETYCSPGGQGAESCDSNSVKTFGKHMQFDCWLYAKATHDLKNNGDEWTQWESACVAESQAAYNYFQFRVIELKQQCAIHDDRYGYGSCDRTGLEGLIEKDGKMVECQSDSIILSNCMCHAAQHYRATIFLSCLLPETTIAVDSVDWWYGGAPITVNSLDSSCTTADYKHYINARIQQFGFPQEIEINMLMMGINVCGMEFDRADFFALAPDPTAPFVLIETPLLRITYHCSAIEHLDVNPALTTPQTFDISHMTEECLDYETAFDPEQKHTDLINCEPYTTEQVSAEWRCRDQCLAYYINNYNYQKYTYSGSSCRATVVYEKDGVINCELYDWFPHQKPVDILELQGDGCHVRDGVQGKHLFQLKQKCYAVGTPAPGPWDASTVIPYISRHECDGAREAFHAGRARETVCSTAIFWKGRGDNPEKTRGDEETFQDYFRGFWTTGRENEVMEEIYGKPEVLFYKDSQLIDFHCRMECLRITRAYFLGDYKLPCRSVLAITVHRFTQGTHKDDYFCVYKYWPRDDKDFCFKTQAPAFDDIRFTEFPLKYICYEPRDIVVAPIEVTTPSVKASPTPPEGYIDNFAQCFAPTVEPAPLFTSEGKKRLSCETGDRHGMQTGSSRENRHEGCARACLHRARDYWYLKKHRTHLVPDCKAVGVENTANSADPSNPFVVHCHYFTWRAGKRDEDCVEVNNKGGMELFVLDSSCYEPEGVTLKACPMFETSQFMASYMLVAPGHEEVLHSGTATFYCSNELIGRFKCKNGEWIRSCNEKGFRCDDQSWHYHFGFKKWYKLFSETPVSFEEAKTACAKQMCNSHLVTIHSAEENEFVAQISKLQETWIGLFNDHAKGAWQWVDNSPYDFKSDLGRCPHLVCPFVNCHPVYGSPNGMTCEREQLHHSRTGHKTCILQQNQEWYWHYKVTKEGGYTIYVNEESCKDYKAKQHICQVTMTEVVESDIVTPLDLSVQCRFVEDKTIDPEAGTFDDIERIEEVGMTKEKCCQLCGDTEDCLGFVFRSFDHKKDWCILKPVKEPLSDPKQDNLGGTYWAGQKLIVNDERKQEVWDDICRQADRQNNVAQLKVCKQVRECERYLKKPKCSKTTKAKKCRELLGIEEKQSKVMLMLKLKHNTFTEKRFTIEWCKQKVKTVGRNKPQLTCIKQCNEILEKEEPYSVAWCQNKMGVYDRMKPALSCVKKCRKILEKNGKITKFSKEYCKGKVEDYGSKKPNISCVVKCRKKFFMT